MSTKSMTLFGISGSRSVRGLIGAPGQPLNLSTMAAMSKKSTLEDRCEGNHCPASSAGEADTIKNMNLTADVLFGVAAVGIVTGVILFFVEGDDESDTEVAVTPAVTASGAGLAVGGRF